MFSFSGREYEVLLENLALMLRSGMSVSEAFAVLAKNSERALQKPIEKMYAQVSEGYPLWKALSEHGKFPDYTIALVRIGEESSSLSDNLTIITKQQTKQRKFKTKVRSAMVYPVFVFTVTILASLGVAWFVLPRLGGIFSQLNTELPLVTQWLLAFGELIAEHGFWFIPTIMMVFLLSIYVIFIFPYTKHLGQWLFLHTPGIRNIIKYVEISRFGHMLHTMLEAGITIDRALSLLAQASDSYAYKKIYRHLEQAIKDGYSFQEACKQSKQLNQLFPFTVQNMLFTAEQGGALSETLKAISLEYEEKMEVVTKNLGAVLEPILLVIVWVFVVGLAVTIILPIYNIVGELN